MEKYKAFPITFATYERTMFSMSWTIVSGCPSSNIKHLELRNLLNEKWNLHNEWVQVKWGREGWLKKYTYSNLC